MTFFYERLAKRILEGTSGLTGNEVTTFGNASVGLRVRCR
jgi:hypothetical protein